MWIHKSLMIVALSLAAGVVVAHPACNTQLSLAGTESLDREKAKRLLLDEQLLCRLSPGANQAPSLLVEIQPAEDNWELDVSSQLDVDGVTAVNIAILNEAFELLRTIPYTNFRERQNRFRIRFVVDEPSIRYLLISGATKANGETLIRSHASLGVKALDFIGVVTGSEQNSELPLRSTGAIYLKRRDHRERQVAIEN